MSKRRTRIRPNAAIAWAAVLMAFASQSTQTQADLVTLKTGVVLEGEVDKDNTILSVYDGLKRVILRDSKVASVESLAAPRFEAFRVDQPIVVHGGAMPHAAVNIRADDWDAKGRRNFQYQFQTQVNGPLRTARMTQAIIELAPRSVRFRGIDGFWTSRMSLSQVPRSVVLSLLKLHHDQNQTNQNERLKVGRFLIQAQMYPEALAELDSIANDFPMMKETVDTVRRDVLGLQAQEELAEIEIRRKAGQARDVASRLKTFPIDTAPPQVVLAVRELRQRDESESQADRALAAEVLKVSEAISEARQEPIRMAVAELLRDLAEIPAVVRDRLGPFQQAESASPPENRMALALSGWLAGKNTATTDLGSATQLWETRQTLLAYLRSRTDAERKAALDSLQAEEANLETLTRLVGFLPPPLRTPQDEEPGRARRLRAIDDANPEPTEYVVVLPPEYHPHRRYPAVVALHSGDGPEAAAKWWTHEAARRGYIVIAPEYNVRGQSRDYRYTASEHAAVEIALRDARKRFAIDSDQVFLGGVLSGGNMAWDFGLGHPDLFAGVVVVSGLPAKYVQPYKDNSERTSWYIVLGDLAPAETDLVQPFVIDMIRRNLDMTYVQYYKRGLEDLPEEAPAIFDWMAARRREAYPKEFKVATARDCDNRFDGIVVHEFLPRRSLPPEQVDPFGKNVRPATIEVKHRTTANLLDLTTNGLARIDVWLSPHHLDLAKRFEIRINGRSVFRGLVKPELAPFLEDLRVRGDREQLYWLRYATSLTPARGR